ncbi:MAG: 1,3-beta-galactosyl-N-acetylhexosamine phosphorylase [Clostridiales bacterium]|jgi:beta-D-galactosyl-(1->4)-L-rhamnose phosphorylase|nr:1,3-beta-galactosyl-N-acetylhexosamine phosphorylase [Clostridiales bacterium]
MPERKAFTMPGEAGHEELVLKLAKRWGADMIRDSDGTKLSKKLLESEFGIYATICIIRGHNEWLKEHQNALQQCFLCTKPKIAQTEFLRLRLMDDFFDRQFKVNDSLESVALWQVFDRTSGNEVPRGMWSYSKESGEILVGAKPWHRYTATFLAWRLWEEISMYNHLTNNWDAEPLMPLDPVYPEARLYLKDWLEKWCEENEMVDVVRFTSFFYNFTWMWSSDPENRNIFTDWASYDFAASPLALRLFEEKYGYRLSAEDFARNGRYNATHRPPGRKLRDWMEFVSDSVRAFAAELIGIVHTHGKLAYVFYDDTWIGLEPGNGKFEEFGLDGIIKCVFSGFEARLCAAAKTPVHELRFHPYLFPVGLGGAPTFSPGGDPASDARRYWINVRRALLRQKVERAGLGGYPRLVADFPDFVVAVEDIMGEFREILKLHEGGTPICANAKIGILHAWGSLRAWTLSGHFHETGQFVLIHLLESLSGLPFEVKFIDFNDLRSGAAEGLDVIINAGRAMDAWSGGDAWSDPDVVSILSKWVFEGGAFIGVSEPSAIYGFDSFFRMAHVLGVDLDIGEMACHGKLKFESERIPELFKGINPEEVLRPLDGVYILDKSTAVLEERNGSVMLSSHPFGKGCGIYISGFKTSPAGHRFLLNLIINATCLDFEYITDNPYTECAVFKDSKKIAFFNNTFEEHEASCAVDGKAYRISLPPGGFGILDI